MKYFIQTRGVYGRGGGDSNRPTIEGVRHGQMPAAPLPVVRSTFCDRFHTSVLCVLSVSAVAQGLVLERCDGLLCAMGKQSWNGLRRVLERSDMTVC